jgi:putative transposase
MPYWRLFYHVVWATKDRQPLIAGNQHQAIGRTIQSAVQEKHGFVHAVGIMPDHIHVVVSIPPSVAISNLVGQMKGLTSYHLNSALNANANLPFRWQAEYGVMSLGEKALADVIAYANNQPARHAANKLWSDLETTTERA